ncbi:hypothetical protein [Clostridium lundense]|nr:hypothetical protein [Clostridium lundense]
MIKMGELLCKTKDVCAIRFIYTSIDLHMEGEKKSMDKSKIRG